MKRPTRLFAIIGAVLGVLLLLLLLAPLFLRGPIEAKAKTAINQSVNAKVDWQDLGLSVFRHFPNLTLSLDRLTAVGTGKFEGDTLAAVKSLRVVVNLASAVGAALGGKPIEIRAIELDEPRLSLLALEDGTANWDIATKGPEGKESSGSSMSIKLKDFEISNGWVTFDNRQSGLLARVRGYRQSLSGDFSSQVTDVQTRIQADTVTVSMGGVPYLNQVRLSLNVDARADLGKKLYTIKTTELKLNELGLNVAGAVESGPKNLGLDLTFNTPSTRFRDILSLVPAVYAHDFDQVKTTGTMALSGKVKGEYGDSIFPSFALNLTVDSAAFQYPDLPLPARDIDVKLAVTNPGGTLDGTVADLQKFHLRLGANPIDARMVLKTPISDPDLDARLAGKVDLADVARTVKLETVDQLSGVISADAAVRTRMSSIKRKEYSRVAATGTIDASNLVLKGKELPQSVAIRQASLQLAPEAAELRSFDGTIGSSDIQATGKLRNLLSFAMQRDTLQGSVTVRSQHFNLDEWMSKDTTQLAIIQVPARIDFDLNATVAELTYDKLKMSNARGRLRVNNQRVTLDDFRMGALGGEIGMNGFYETTDSTKPTFDVAFRMTKVDIPSAFKAFTTVQMLAPIAKYATGEVTTDLNLTGGLGKNMMPLFQGLNGKGNLSTSQLLIKDFPPLEKAVDVTKLNFLNNPTLQALKAAFAIRDGRLFMNPFDVKLGPVAATISGSNGLDQSLDYNLNLKVPRALLGGGANQALSGLLAKAGKAGVDLNAAPEIPLGIKFAGKLTSPDVSADVGSLTSSVAGSVQDAAKVAVTEKVDSAKAKLVAEAEQRAAAIKQQAESTAAQLKREAYARADSLEAKASTPLAKVAAKPAADQIRKQADKKAASLVSEASKRADSLVAGARRE